MRRAWWARALVLAMAASVSGCYSYIPSEFAAIPPGQSVRLYVTQRALAELTEFPIGDGAVVNGTLVRTESNTVVVRVPIATRREGFSAQVLGQDVFIASDQVLQVERRELNKVATALMTVGSTALLTGVVLLIITGARRGEQQPPSTDVELNPSISVPNR